MLAEGHKLKLARVHWDRGRLVHKTHGPLPAVGARAQLFLDAERRVRQARAHAAMHLLIAAVAESRGRFVDTPAVVGGGEVRLHTKLREDAAVALPKLLARGQQLADAREDVTARWLPRDEAAKLVTESPTPLDDIVPGEPTMRVVQCGAKSLLPCDAPLVDHTWEIGAMKLTLAQKKSDAVRWGVRVA